MAVLILCYKSDLVACGVLGAFLDEQCLQGECRGAVERQLEELENFGALRHGFVERLGPSRTSQRITLAILEDHVSTALALRRLSQTPDKAIQVMTIHDWQKEKIQKLLGDEFAAQGYAVFRNRPTPLVDVGSSLVLSEDRADALWYRTMANVLVGELVIPKPPTVMNEQCKTMYAATSPVFVRESLPYG